MKNKPSDYRAIKLWNKLTGSLPYYWEAQQEKAAAADAPLDALYERDGIWRCASDLESGHTFLQSLAEETGEHAPAAPAPAAPAADDTTPTKDWATWALLSEWNDLAFNYSTPEAIRLSQLIARRLRETVGMTDHGPRSFVVMTDDGHWGRGEDLGNAARIARKAGGSLKSAASVFLVLNDAEPGLNDYGQLVSAAPSAQLRIGVVGTLGGILKANPITKK